jgi:3-dehydroquinate synthase
MTKIIQSVACEIEIGSLSESSFSKFLSSYSGAKKIIFVDENTHDYCLEYLLTAFEELNDAEVMLLPAGEENKVMEVCFQVWEAMTEYQIGRSDLILNLGGGIVTDMGGFIASIYKRGIHFIHIPTSLLGMVDASIGNKTGIDLGKFKNQLGVFASPKHIFVDPGFLQTLPVEEIANGFAEMLKHALIADKDYWALLSNFDLQNETIPTAYLEKSIEIKNTIVLSDPTENGARKKLNFGHTFGHAIEGILLGTEDEIAHGHAVAIGIVAEAFISFKRNLIEKNTFVEIEKTIRHYFHVPVFALEIDHELFNLMQNDKKNFENQVQCTLLKGIGESIVNQAIDKKEVTLVLEYLAHAQN